MGINSLVVNVKVKPNGKTKITHKDLKHIHTTSPTRLTSSNWRTSTAKRMWNGCNPNLYKIEIQKSD